MKLSIFYCSRWAFLHISTPSFHVSILGLNIYWQCKTVSLSRQATNHYHVVYMFIVWLAHSIIIMQMHADAKNNNPISFGKT